MFGSKGVPPKPPPPPPPNNKNNNNNIPKPPPPSKYIHCRNLDGISIFVDTISGMPLWVLPSGVDIQHDIQHICIMNDDRTHYFKDFNTNTITQDLPEQNMSGNARSVCYALLHYNNDQCSSFMENPYNAKASKSQDDMLNKTLKKLYDIDNSNDKKTKNTKDNEDIANFLGDDQDIANILDPSNNNNNNNNNTAIDDENDENDNLKASVSDTSRESKIYLRQSEVGEIYIEGYMMKLARSSERNWKNRYFLLSRMAISYYSKGRPLTKSLGDLIITGDTKLVVHQEELHGFSFRISNEYGTIKMAASTKEESAEWTEKINMVIEMNKKMCCAYLQKRNYRLGFTNTAKKFFILTDDKITVHPSVEKITCVESMIRLYSTSQISYDDKKYRMTFIDSNPNSTKNEVTIQFPDTGLEFSVWRSFILKNVVVDDDDNINTNFSPPPPPPSSTISPIERNPSTPKINQDYDPFNSFDAAPNTATNTSSNMNSNVNALEAAKARREARNNESKHPSSSKQFFSKLTSTIPFYPSAKSTPDNSFKPNAYGLTSKDNSNKINNHDINNNDINNNDVNNNDINNSDINDNGNERNDDSNREIDVDLKEDSKSLTDSSRTSARFSFRSARKMFEKKNVTFGTKPPSECASSSSYGGGVYESKSNPDDNEDNDIQTKADTRVNIAAHAIKLADFNPKNVSLSSPNKVSASSPISSSLSSPLPPSSPSPVPSSSSSSPLPPPSSPYLSFIQNDVMDYNPNTNLIRSFDHAGTATNNIDIREKESEKVINNRVYNSYKNDYRVKIDSSINANANTNTNGNIDSPRVDKSSIHSIESFIASVSSSREDILRQFHNNVQQISVFINEPKDREGGDIKSLKESRIQRDSKYCQTDQRIYMDDIHRRPYELLVAEKEELIIAREKLALDVTTALAHIKKEEEASLQKIKEADSNLKKKYEDIQKDLENKRLKQEEEHKQLVETFELTRKAADHLHKKRLSEVQLMAKALSKHHDKVLNERQLIAVQRFQLYLALQNLNESGTYHSTSKYPILKEEVHKVYHPKPLSPAEVLQSYGTKAKNVAVKNKLINTNNKMKSKAIGRSFVYGSQY